MELLILGNPMWYYSEVQKYLYTFLWVYCVCSRAIHCASDIYSRVLKLPKGQIM